LSSPQPFIIPTLVSWGSILQCRNHNLHKKEVTSNLAGLSNSDFQNEKLELFTLHPIVPVSIGYYSVFRVQADWILTLRSAVSCESP
jgi:hypothetical protein